MKVADGIIQTPPVFSAEGKGPGDADRADCIQPVGILNNPALRCFGVLSPVLTERDRVNRLTDPLNSVRIYPLRSEESPRIGIILRAEQLVIIRIMKQSRQGDNLLVTVRLLFRNVHGVPVNAHGMGGIMAAGVVPEEFFHIFNCSINDGHFPAPFRTMQLS